MTTNMKTKKDKLGYMMYVVGGVIVAMFIAYKVHAKNIERTNRVDPKTLCKLKEKPKVRWDFVVDKTDRLTDQQSGRVNKELERIKNRAQKGDQISVFFIRDGVTRFTLMDPVFTKCIPATGEDANFFTEGEDYYKRKFEVNFGKPFKEVQVKVEAKEEFPESSIIEAIAALGDTPEYADEEVTKHLILISNGLQNTQTFSLYEKKTPSFTELKKTQYYKMINPSLGKNTEVEFVYLISPETEALQNEMHRKFWHDLLIDANAKKVDIRPVKRF